MKLWEMSFVGAVMVCGILLVRAADRRPYQQEVSVSSMTGENQQPETVPAGREPGEKVGESYETQLYPAAGTLRSPGWYPVLRGIWLLGAAAVGVYFAIQYLIHRRKMRELLPAEDWPVVESWRGSWWSFFTGSIRWHG